MTVNNIGSDSTGVLGLKAVSNLNTGDDAVVDDVDVDDVIVEGEEATSNLKGAALDGETIATLEPLVALPLLLVVVDVVAVVVESFSFDRERDFDF